MWIEEGDGEEEEEAGERGGERWQSERRREEEPSCLLVGGANTVDIPLLYLKATKRPPKGVTEHSAI